MRWPRSTQRLRSRSCWQAGLALVVALSSCSPSDPTVGDSKTNWLLACDGNVDCDAPSVCMCHVCTRPCADTCADLNVPAQCAMPEISVCDTEGVAVCLPPCSDNCVAPAQCIDNICITVPVPWSIEPPRSLRLVRCMMPVGDGCAAGNEVYQLILLSADGSAVVSDPMITGTWMAPSTDVLVLRFQRSGAEPVTFNGMASTEAGCFEGAVDDPNTVQATTFTACLLP